MEDERALNEDLGAVEPPTLVKVAAAIGGIAAVFVGLTGVQMLGARWTEPWLDYVPYPLMLLGVLGLTMAAYQYRARAWAGIGAAVACGLNALAAAAWGIFGLTHGIISCMAILAVPATMLAALLAVLSIKGVRDTAAARRRLEEQGLGLGL